MSELRQRKPGSEKPEGDAKGDGLSTEEKVTMFVEAFSEKTPENVKVYVKAAAPYIGMIAKFCEFILPFLVSAYVQAKQLWKDLAPYNPELLAPALAGLVMCFFGGSYMTLIAAAEAYRICGYQSTLKCIELMRQDFLTFWEASEKDDKEDKDGDGVKDVLQLTKNELATRKTLLFMRTVDPERLTMCIGTINSGFLAVVATLKLQFAKAITLGTSIGELMDKPAQRYITPTLEMGLGDEYKKWGKSIVSTTIKMFAISIAWFVQRVISAYHSAIRGGLMFSRNICEYLSKKKIFEIDHNKSYLDEVVGYGMAVVGLYFQLRFGFKLPFPLNLILLPFTILEYLLMWVVNAK